MSWPTVQLGRHVAKLGSGVTPRGGDSVYVDEGTALIRSQNVFNNHFHADGLAYITDAQADKMKGVSVYEGDVLLNITGDSVARCCRVPAEVLPARVNQHVMIIRPRPDAFDSRYLAYQLTSPFFQSSLLSVAGSGGTRKALTKAMIERLDVPQPAIREQKRIASILSAYDDLIANNRRRIALLEEAARQLYKEWFVRFRFPGHEHVELIDGVPEGWERLPLREVATLNYGKALKAEARVDGGTPVYGSSGIVGSHNKALVEGPGIILGRKGNVGSVWWSHTDFFPIDTVYFISSDQSNFYLYLTLQNMQFMSTDVAVPGLNRDFAYSRLLIRPAAKVAEQFEDEVSPIFLQAQKLTDWNSKIAQARDLLLPRLMNGTLAV